LVAWLVAGGISLASITVCVIYLLSRAAAVRAALGEREAALEVEREHLAAEEKAAAAARAARAEELDAKASTVNDPKSAADLLRDVFNRPR
jgi:peptidoglycan hydrolase CwlO-like protein